MNPAARVLDLYDRFKALGRKQEANTQLQAIWAQVFDLQPEDKPEEAE